MACFTASCSYIKKMKRITWVTSCQSKLDKFYCGKFHFWWYVYKKNKIHSKFHPHVFHCFWRGRSFTHARGNTPWVCSALGSVLGTSLILTHVILTTSWGGCCREPCFPYELGHQVVWPASSSWTVTDGIAHPGIVRLQSMWSWLL